MQQIRMLVRYDWAPKKCSQPLHPFSMYATTDRSGGHKVIAGGCRAKVKVSKIAVAGALRFAQIAVAKGNLMTHESASLHESSMCFHIRWLTYSYSRKQCVIILGHYMI